MTHKVLSSHPNIIDAVKELEYWIHDSYNPYPNHIARINKRTLDLLFDKHEDNGEFVNQWIKLGTHQELQQMSSISDHITNCLDNFINK